MTPHKIPLLVLAAAVLGSVVYGASDKRRKTPAGAETPTAAMSPANGFEAFQLIVERNIFNPNRVGRTKAVPEEKPPRIDEISLVGTMTYDQQVMAFFDSPDAAFRKTARVGDTVGDFKVQSIAADGVELVRDNQPLTLKVAQQLRRPEGGNWTVRAAPAAAPASGGSVYGLPPESTGPVEIPADASEALKRLLKNREKQLSK